MFVSKVIRGTYPLVEQWKTWQYAKGLSKRTVTERTGLIIRLAEACNTQPQSVTTDNIVEWMAEGEWSPNTRWTYHTTLASWFKWLQKLGIRDDNPMLHIDSPRRHKGEPHPISDDDLIRLLKTRAHTRTKAMLLLAAYQGLRVHEIAKIKGEHFNLSDDTLMVVGKGNAKAVMPLHRAVANLAETMPKKGYWFPGPDRGHQRRESISGTIKETMIRAGVPGSAHSLRHWFGTALVEAGVDLRTVQTLMRHQNLATTEIYTKVSQERRADAINTLNPTGSRARLRVVRDTQEGWEAAQTVVALAYDLNPDLPIVVPENLGIKK
jgi:site-specific recombinase XerD